MNLRNLFFVAAVGAMACLFTVAARAADAIYDNEGADVVYTPTTGNVTAGDVVVLDNGLVGVAVRGITSNKVGAVRVNGAFRFAKGTNLTFTTWGIPVYWAASGVAQGTGLATGAVSQNPADGPYAGYTLETLSTTNAPTVRVQLNARRSSGWPNRLEWSGTNLIATLPTSTNGLPSGAMWVATNVVRTIP
jgi:hypothetical protein